MKLWSVLKELSPSSFECGSASSGQSGGLDEGCCLQKVLRVAPPLFLQRCSMGLLLPSSFRLKRGQNYRTCSSDCGPVCFRIYVNAGRGRYCFSFVRVLNGRFSQGCVK